MKPFKTIEEQIQILETRRLHLGDTNEEIERVKLILKNENYYSIINGYKDLFLEAELVNGEERYKKGASFREIYALYNTDKKIRILLLELILEYESSLKTKSAYYFAAKYKDEPHAYLDYNKYGEDKFSALKIISAISSIISRDSNKKHFRHYINKYEHLPIWVVATSFTFGNLQYFYQNIPVKNDVAKEYSLQFERDYCKQIHITPTVMMRINHILNFFRNVCAHGEILYNFKVFKFSKEESIFNSTFNQSEKLYKNDGSFFNAIAYLQLVIPKKIFEKFLLELEKILNKLLSEISTFTRDDLYRCMGLKTNQIEDGLELLKNACNN